ncbi:MAG: biotin--[acetyl-CoA-carboxylase] ligase, partial [Clostridia bacterium]|nr:biotin--[acetyl-CoA-carboxylase] ligase [Clostridia bacterium]
ETRIRDRINAVIVGIGVNFVAVPLPEDIKNKAGALYDTPPQIDRDTLMGAIAGEMLSISENLSDRTFMNEYRDNSMILGEEVSYELGGITHIATAVDIDNDGALYVKSDSGNITKINSGEVSIKRLYN